MYVECLCSNVYCLPTPPYWLTVTDCNLTRLELSTDSTPRHNAISWTPYICRLSSFRLHRPRASHAPPDHMLTPVYHQQDPEQKTLLTLLTLTLG